ncbi:MAG: hypothetical protein AAFY42_04955 [Pseudomonadota bacterium]
MDKQSRSEDVASAALPLFAALSTGAAVFAWAEALDFDPCDTILTHGGADCVEAGLGGFIIGTAFALFGLSIAYGAIWPRIQGQVPKKDRLFLGWFGLMFAATGAAVSFAQWTVGLGL